ncbi:MAG TPA: nicotinate phosphoribosyltransferase, partial [Jatrophihabitantaceae bacterium]|nr:nicotinate phosphoribosyltransferase [Jatrophihabitantaceae bacterium]
KTAYRAHKDTGTALEEIVATGPAPELGEHDRLLQRPMMRGGSPVTDLPGLDDSREHLRRVMVTLPWDGLKLSRGEPAIPTRLITA